MARRLAAYSCGGSPGIEPGSLFILVSEEPVASGALRSADGGVNFGWSLGWEQSPKADLATVAYGWLADLSQLLGHVDSDPTVQFFFSVQLVAQRCVQLEVPGEELVRVEPRSH